MKYKCWQCGHELDDKKGLMFKEEDTGMDYQVCQVCGATTYLVD